ncbi:MAG: cation:proton antiporter, partial [Alphaproteobacteria bacterium]
FQAIALLLVTTAAAAYINHRFFRLPHTIGVALAALAGSIAVIAIDAVIPSLGMAEHVVKFVNDLEFGPTLLDGMLSFLLFAGALHVDLDRLAQRKWAIATLATVGVLISTFVVGGIVYFGLQAIGQPIPFIWALAFGALISPTDPVATLGILKSFSIPPSVQAKIAGESLFNDGVGVVVFIVIVGIASSTGSDVETTILFAGETFLLEAVGGGVLGLVAGYIAFLALRSIDDHVVEILVTLALATGAYALAASLHLSGPIAVVIAGLLIGNQGVDRAMSDHTRDNLLRFWELSDEILNSILFLLLGMEAVVIGFTGNMALAGVIAIFAMLIGRTTAVTAVIMALRRTGDFTKGAAPALIWGGLKGGISVALALSLPDVEAKPLLLGATYIAVVFSIVFQGLTLQRVLKHSFGESTGPTRKLH